MVLRLEDGDLLVVIAPVGSHNLVKDYALRWGIETLFGIFKTRGFCLESTHFTDDKRVSKFNFSRLLGNADGIMATAMAAD